jgi:hypothetical protein
MNEENTTIAEWTSDTVRIVLTATPDGAYHLTWDDFVANEWEEVFTNPAVAVARFAVLLHCEQRGWNVGFNSDADAFATDAAGFLANVTTQS